VSQEAGAPVEASGEEVADAGLAHIGRFVEWFRSGKEGKEELWLVFHHEGASLASSSTPPKLRGQRWGAGGCQGRGVIREGALPRRLRLSGSSEPIPVSEEGRESSEPLPELRALHLPPPGRRAAPVSLRHTGPGPSIRSAQAQAAPGTEQRRCHGHTICNALSGHCARCAPRVLGSWCRQSRLQEQRPEEEGDGEATGGGRTGLPSDALLAWWLWLRRTRGRSTVRSILKQLVSAAGCLGVCLRVPLGVPGTVHSILKQLVSASRCAIH